MIGVSGTGQQREREGIRRGGTIFGLTDGRRRRRRGREAGWSDVGESRNKEEAKIGSRGM